MAGRLDPAPASHLSNDDDDVLRVRDWGIREHFGWGLPNDFQQLVLHHS